jgi:hypothetical protein
MHQSSVPIAEITNPTNGNSYNYEDGEDPTS